MRSFITKILFLLLIVHSHAALSQQGYQVTGTAPASLEGIATPSDKDLSFSLQTYKGKYILLDFWASWCGPCIQGLPALKAFYGNFHAQGGEVIRISLDDDKSKWLSAIKKHDLP
jgi:thiol-disulfide isomerase/thioredoxin